MAFKKYTVGQYSTYYTSDIGYHVFPKKYDPATVKVIIGCHGRGGTGYQYGVPPLAKHTVALADAGYYVLGIDHARINSWGDSDAMSAISDAYITTFTQLGQPYAKIGMMGWSMGGITALNWIRELGEQYVQAAWLWNPAVDLRFHHDAAAAYTPPYTFSGPVQGNPTYATEIEQTFGAAANTISAVTIPASTSTSSATVTFTTGEARRFGHATTTAPMVASVNGVNFTYTGRSGNNKLTGCKSTTTSSIAVAIGNTVTGAYNEMWKGYSPYDNYAAFSNLSSKIHISMATDDATAPANAILDPAVGFVARAANPNITATATTGGHVNSISEHSSAAVVNWFKKNF